MKRFRLGVAARVVAHGLLLLALVAASVLFVDRLVLRPAMRQRAAELIPWFAERAAEHRNNPPRLAHEFQDMHRMLRFEITLYDRSGAIRATTVTPALPPPPAAALLGLAQGRMAWIGADLAAVQLFAGGLPDGYVVLHNAPPSIPLDFAVTLLIMAIVVVAIASVPLTRSMLRPLRELARATRAYANGDRDARVHLQRNDEFGDLAFAFNDMVAHVEALRRSEKQLLANVSHELRTPLARVRVLLELASDGEPGEVASVLPEIAQDLGELERLVDDVLTTARLDLSRESAAGALDLPMHFAEHDARQLVDRWRARFGSQAPARQLHIECADALPRLRCDPVLLRRAVDNLLDNAARYSPAEQPIELHLGRHGDRLRIEVVDHGTGIAAADLARVFEPFYRVEQSRDRRRGGMGLGLSLARRIIEAHGGSLTLNSVPQVGTRAIVELPLPAGNPLANLPSLP